MFLKNFICFPVFCMLHCKKPKGGADMKALIGMSGGVDSSVAAWLTMETGDNCIGATMRLYAENTTDTTDAELVARRLGIPFHVLDLSEDFRCKVMESFAASYEAGLTPNPCIECNKEIKFGVMLDYALEIGCDCIATGHYAQIESTPEGRYFIRKGADEHKDQSYFLWRLPQEVLRRFLFPLGNYTKQEVREYLKEKGFEAKAKGGESMEVCFIEGDYRDFLRQQIPDIDTKIGPGLFVDSKGGKIGQHKGFPYYTIGQRKGLGIALGHPAHVLRINAEKNTVMLGTAEDLKAEYMLVEDAMIINMQELLECPNLTVRIRYRSKPIPCQVLPLENGQMLVHFLEDASAITPGQSAVFYDGKRVLGGAFIASQRGIFKVIAENPF